ncbi:MAG: S-methyl-5-thioribose-1-phosphate isomerase, partial [Deltaproteobacteria bacterium]|nr:S-methyl-5-thioribose-1-phosphate isomerase [Deltaproteobacteria bacterium]
MKVDGKDIRTIWYDEYDKTVKIIDQRKLPHELVIVELKTVDDAIKAIKDMYVRGAPLIGVTGAYAVYLATINAPDGQIDTQYLQHEARRIKSARPTAVNLVWGVDMVLSKIVSLPDHAKKIDAAKKISAEIAELEVENCRQIGEQGLSIIEQVSQKKEGKTVNVLT